MPYLLNLIYLLLILICLPWLLWQSLRKGKYREGYGAKLLGRVPERTSDKTCVWLHAVSVGEVNLLAPLLKKIEQARPDWECVISTTTTAGMALARKKYAGHEVFYCPLDFSWAVGEAVRRIRPDLLVLAELELWPNLIRAAKRSGAKAAVINGRLSEKSFRGYRRIRPLAAKLLRQVDLLAVQDETYAERFRQLGARPETIRVTGSMKYDGAQTDRDNPATRRLAALAGFAEDDIVLLAGSTQEPEEAMALETFEKLRVRWPKLRLVLVPRHPDRFDAVGKLLDSSGVSWQRRTELGTGDGRRGAGDEGVGSGQWPVASGQNSSNHPSLSTNHYPLSTASNPQSLIPNPSRPPSPAPRLWLQTSPEFAMKRLLAAGAGRIYEVARVFRLDELGPLHNPEFTLVEWYQPGEDLDAGMQLTSDLCETLLSDTQQSSRQQSSRHTPCAVARKTNDADDANEKTADGTRSVPATGAAERISYAEAFERYVGVDPHTADGRTLAAMAKRLGVEAPASLPVEDRDGWLDLLMVERVQPHLGQGRPTLLYHYPASQAALARVRPGHPPVAERFELYVNGIELANGYDELLDPAELRARNAWVNAQRLADGKPALPEESRLLAAMQFGLPPSVGVALGFDRLAMLAAGVDSIAQVVAFPFDRA